MRVPSPLVDRMAGDRSHPGFVAWCTRHGVDPATVELPPSRAERVARPRPPTDTEKLVAALSAEGIIPVGKRAAVVRGLDLDAERVARAEDEHTRRKR